MAREDASVLVLGSAPSVRSLILGQYYAHPHNAFWPIMGEMFGAGPDKPYTHRLDLLQDKRVALWDVLAECQRQGSADSAIEPDSIRPNDFGTFLDSHPSVRAIVFNGRKAHEVFCRRVWPDLEAAGASVMFSVLPSTSAANAAVSLEEKLEKWRVVKNLARGDEE